MMNEYGAKPRSPHRLVLLVVFVVAAVSIAIVFVPQKRSESVVIEMVSPGTTAPEVFVNGTSMGHAPVKISIDDIFAMSKPEHVPVAWSPNSLTVTSANHTRSGYSVHAGVDMSAPTIPSQPHIMLVRRDGPDPGDVQIGAIEVIVRDADGTEWGPETVGASIVSIGPRWTADLRMLFAPAATPIEP